MGFKYLDDNRNCNKSNEIPVNKCQHPIRDYMVHNHAPYHYRRSKTLGELIDKKVTTPIQEEINKEIEKDYKKYNPYEEIDHTDVNTSLPLTKHEEYTLNYIAIDLIKVDYDAKYHEMFDNTLGSIYAEFRAAVINALELGVNKLVKQVYDHDYIISHDNRDIVYSRDASRLRDAFFSFYNTMNEALKYIGIWNLSNEYKKQLDDAYSALMKVMDIFAKYCKDNKFRSINMDPETLMAKYDKDTQEIVDGWALFDE